MTMQKPKLDKRKHVARTWLDRFFGARRIDFVAPVSLEKSVEVIETYMPKTFWRLWAGDAYTRVNLTQLDEGTFEFHLFQIGFRFVAIKCKGHLNRLEADITHVSATIRPAYEVVILLLSIAGLLFFRGVSYLILPIIATASFVVYLAFAQHMADNVKDKLETILSAKSPDKHKKHAYTGLERLFGARRIDFVSSLSLEECVARFERVNAERHSWFHRPSTTIDVHPIDADTYQLKLINKGRNTRLELVGYVKRWEQDSSRIMMNAKPQYIEHLVALVLIGVLAAGLALLSPFVAVFAILPAIFVWILFSEVVNNIQFQLEQYLEKSE